MNRYYYFPLLNLVLALLITSRSSEAKDQTLLVEAARVRDTLRERAAVNRFAEVRLRDSSVSTGRIAETEDEALKLNLSSGRAAPREILIPYAQISTIRLDLGASRGWRIWGAILGAMFGSALGVMATMNSTEATTFTAYSAGAAGGGYLGYKLGARHRRRLIIEVH